MSERERQRPKDCCLSPVWRCCVCCRARMWSKRKEGCNRHALASDHHAHDPPPPQLTPTHAPPAPPFSKPPVAAGFLKYSFAATKHKDTETQSSSIYGQGDLANPPNSLTDYIDGDNIRNQDVVVWVNSGL